jgi:hypothetical protein
MLSAMFDTNAVLSNSFAGAASSSGLQYNMTTIVVMLPMIA